MNKKLKISCLMVFSDLNDSLQDKIVKLRKKKSNFEVHFEKMKATGLKNEYSAQVTVYSDEETESLFEDSLDIIYNAGNKDFNTSILALKDIRLL